MRRCPDSFSVDGACANSCRTSERFSGLLVQKSSRLKKLGLPPEFGGRKAYAVENDLESIVRVRP
jgi:hypothetical protein